MSMTVASGVRDLDSDLEIATRRRNIGGMLRYALEAIEGWPYAIRRALAAEKEADKLRAENELLLEQLNQHHISHCHD